jgi:23S rRNA (adenine2503-C2)-methyltransferase
MDLLSLSLSELKEIVKDKLEIEPYRAEQIYSWMYKVSSFSEMSNISGKHKKLLSEHFYIKKLEISKKSVSGDGTIKYLFDLGDGNKIESVFMKYHHGNTVCISVQVGCRMDCAFCASSIGGLVRNLTPAEMLLQVINIERDTGARVANIVLMGIGEPLDNFENVIKFIEFANVGLNIGLRHISLSTCGLVDKINELKLKSLPITLSVSLHAPNDEIRGGIMPVNNKYKMDKLLQACKSYAKHTKRRISFEYILINNLNDSEQNARELASCVKNILCHVNLIPVNRVYRQAEKEFAPPSRKKAGIFRQVLESCGINATFRRKCGDDVEASCGQLRINNLD